MVCRDLKHEFGVLARYRRKESIHAAVQTKRYSRHSLNHCCAARSHTIWCARNYNEFAREVRATYVEGLLQGRNAKCEFQVAMAGALRCLMFDHALNVRRCCNMLTWNTSTAIAGAKVSVSSRSIYSCQRRKDIYDVRNRLLKNSCWSMECSWIDCTLITIKKPLVCKF